MMANGTDEDGAHAARMDGWIAWESEEVKERGGRRISYVVADRSRTLALSSFLGRISLRDERRCLEIKIK